MELVVSILSVVLVAVAAGALVCSIWLFFWTRGIPRRALSKTAQEHGVSEAFMGEVIVNIDDLVAGKITQEEWERRTVQLAYRHPQESGLREILLEEERRQ